MLLWAGQGLSATHMLWKNCHVLQLLPGRLGGWPEIKGISCRNPGASPHLVPQESPEKIPDATAIEFPPCRLASSTLCCTHCTGTLLLLAVPHLGLNKESLQRTDLLLDAGAHRELLFWLLLLHSFFVPQTLLISADEAEANTGNPRHWELYICSPPSHLSPTGKDLVRDTLEIRSTSQFGG